MQCPHQMPQVELFLRVLGSSAATTVFPFVQSVMFHVLPISNSMKCTDSYRRKGHSGSESQSAVSIGGR